MHLEATVAREIEQHPAVVRIVLDDQQHGIARLRLSRSSGIDSSCARRPAAPPAGYGDRGAAGALPMRSSPLHRRAPTYVSGRYSVKVLPLPAMLLRRISPPSRCASSRLMASPRPVPPYLRAVPASACWNASKMIRCFSGGMPMPVSLTENSTTDGRLAQSRVVRSPAAGRNADVQPHAAAVGELEGVRQQVLQHLQQALGVGRDRAPQARVEVGRERQLARVRLVAEVALDRLAQVREQQVLALDRDRARLDLRQVQNVADEVEQVGAGAVDGLGELDLAAAAGSCPRSRRAAGPGSGCC